VKTFFTEHPLLKDYQADVEQLYRKHQYHYVWYDKNGINEFGSVLYSKVNSLKEEGIQNVVPYLDQLDRVYDDMDDNHKPNVDTELLNSALYFYYTKTVYHGLDAAKSKEMEWYLPRKKQSYVNYLDALLEDASLINKDEKGVLSQYFLLKDFLLNTANWKRAGVHVLDPKFKSLLAIAPQRCANKTTFIHLK
jgi:hypothetical protein